MAYVTSNIIFRDGLFRLAVPMSGDQITSENISCNDLNDPTLPQGQRTRGSLTPGAIIFPASWAASDVVFSGFLDDTFTNPFDIMTGGASNTLYTISNCAPNTQVPLNINIFSNIKYFVIKSIALQTGNPVPTIVFFPLEQLSA